MGTLSLSDLKNGFNNLLYDARPVVIPEFFAWVDVKISEYKSTGYRKRGYVEICQVETSSPVSVHRKLNPPAVEVESHKPCVITNDNMKSSQPMISRDGSNKLPSMPTSQASPLNLSPAQNGALAKLLATNHTGSLYSSKLALKVPSVPVSPYSCSPVSYQSSPPPGTTAVKPDSYSALRSLLQGSARMNLTAEFEEKHTEDSDGVGEDERGKSHDCLECGKSFVHRSSYRRHMKIHQGVFSHHCNTCERKFTRKEHFLRHKCALVKPGDYGHVEDWGGLASSPVKLEGVWQSVVPSPLEGGTGYTAKTPDMAETGSESSGQGSPNYYPESRRKKSAPRKVVPDVETQNESYFSDLDESIYDSMGMKTEYGALDFSMKSRKKREEYSLESTQNGLIDLSMKPVKVLSEKQAAVVAGEEAVANKPRLDVENFYPTLYDSPPAGFRIGDLIESAVAKYHSADVDNKYMSPVKAEERAEFLANNRPVVLTPLREATQADDQVGDGSAVKSDPSDPKGGETNFLSTTTGTYQITTEEMDSDSPMTEDGTPNKVIKVVKQGNYLKLKKEAQLIDGELRFICPHCNKVFHRSSNFSRHMRIHRGVFSYICSACNRGFYRKEHFDKHKCYRKAMATTWDRKTRVDMDHESGEVGDKENAGYPVESGQEMGMVIDLGDVHPEEDDQEYPVVYESDEEASLVIDEGAVTPSN